MSIINLDGLGDSRDKPRTLGKPNDADAVFVETTGLYEGLPKGTQAWVTGSKVQIGIHRGNLIPIGTDTHEPVVTKVTRVSAQEPPQIIESKPWANEPAPEPATDTVDDEPDVPTPDGEVYNPADHSIPKVIQYIEDHPDEAGAVLAAERAGKNRKGIINEFS